MIKDLLNGKFDIIIIAGQSNAESSGEGPSYNSDWVEDDDILMLKGDFDAKVAKKAYGNEYLDIEVSDKYYIERAKERIINGKVCAIFGNYFAKMYKENRLEKDRKILLIQTAIGGTGFAKWHWGLKDALYNRMLKMTEQALALNPENRVVALLWHQGEHDSFEPPEMEDNVRKQTYKKNLSALIDGVREKFGNKLPFICAGFTKYWVNEYPNQCAAVLGATKEVCESINDARFIEKTDDLEVNDEAVGNGDTVHFSRRALYILAERYYNAYKEIVENKGRK
ncbi:MAG: hypothetical protein IJV95_02030 [Clostridia bacterium]|nr:hypothetical protein [Clostridia bacterium]